MEKKYKGITNYLKNKCIEVSLSEQTSEQAMIVLFDKTLINAFDTTMW